MGDYDGGGDADDDDDDDAWRLRLMVQMLLLMIRMTMMMTMPIIPRWYSLRLRCLSPDGQGRPVATLAMLHLSRPGLQQTACVPPNDGATCGAARKDR